MIAGLNVLCRSRVLFASLFVLACGLIAMNLLGWFLFGRSGPIVLIAPSASILVILLANLVSRRHGKILAIVGASIYLLGLAFGGWAALEERGFLDDDTIIVDIIEFIVLTLLAVRAYVTHAK